MLLSILIVDEVVKSGDVNKLMLFRNTCAGRTYYAGEVKGATRLKPRFKFNVCPIEEANNVKPEVIIFKMRKCWDKWVKTHYPILLTPREHQRLYMKELESRLSRDCFRFIDIY